MVFALSGCSALLLVPIKRVMTVKNSADLAEDMSTSEACSERGWTHECKETIDLVHPRVYLLFVPLTEHVCKFIPRSIRSVRLIETDGDALFFVLR